MNFFLLIIETEKSNMTFLKQLGKWNMILFYLFINSICGVADMNCFRDLRFYGNRPKQGWVMVSHICLRCVYMCSSKKIDPI